MSLGEGILIIGLCVIAGECARLYLRARTERLREGQIWRDRFFVVAEKLASDNALPAEYLEQLNEDISEIRSKNMLLCLLQALHERQKNNGRKPAWVKTPELPELPAHLAPLWKEEIITYLVSLTYTLPVIGMVARARMIEIFDTKAQSSKTAEAVAYRISHRRHPRRTATP